MGYFVFNKGKIKFVCHFQEIFNRLLHQLNLNPAIHVFVLLILLFEHFGFIEGFTGVGHLIFGNI
jgi:hypothetical protein